MEFRAGESSPSWAGSRCGRMAVSGRDCLDRSSMNGSVTGREFSLPPGTAASTKDGNSSMIAVHGLLKKIGAQEILRGVDLDVARGETLAIIGRSGGGKSVLLKHLIGLMRPDAGEIWIEGQNIISMTERQLRAISPKRGTSFAG